MRGLLIGEEQRAAIGKVRERAEVRADGGTVAVSDEQVDPIDATSDILKRAAVRGRPLPEIEIAAWYVNEADGPQFWTGQPPLPGMKPLYYTPAKEGQEPVAWKCKSVHLVTQNPSMYREDLEWVALYAAR